MSHILLIEDHDLTRKTLQRRLTKAGHTVVEAENGEAGIAILSKKNIDLVLIDFMMKHMNGMQIFEKIKELKPQVPCAMISAYANQGLHKQFISQGGVDFMVKPIGDDFEQRIDTLMYRGENRQSQSA